MKLTFFPVPDDYLLDSSSIIRLDGKDRVPPVSPFTTDEQSKIWDGLERLAKDGRLKLIRQVREELARHDPAGLKRLKEISGVNLIVRRTPDIVLKYQRITTAHPDLMKGGSRFDPADPWLILASEMHGHIIITEELSKTERTTLITRKLKLERIPDVCVARKLEPAIKLRDLAIHEGWI
jgi:hypothetical protein